MRMTLATALAAGTMLVISGGAGLAQEVINAVHFVPTQNSYTQSFLKFVEKLNERGEGVVQIRVRGGPEVVPTTQQGQALKSGLIDMINTPFGQFLDLVPEGEALSATTKTTAELRENGGWDLLEQISNEKANMHLLAHVDAGSGFHIFTVDEPVRTANGGIDWTGLKIRSSPLYRTFFEDLGATVIVQGPGEVYTSLERGVINSSAFTIFGYKAYGWDKFTRYRIDPSFFQTDVLIAINKTKWDSLSEEAKEILTTVALEHEAESSTANAVATKAEGDAMIAEGQQVFELEGEAREEFLAKASEASWKRMEERDPTHIQALRADFQ